MKLYLLERESKMDKIMSNEDFKELLTAYERLVDRDLQEWVEENLKD